MSEIKIKRARKLSSISACPGSFEAMMDLIPVDVLASVTGAQLARMIDALWRACGQSKAIAERDACAKGAIWDARAERLREIAA